MLKFIFLTFFVSSCAIQNNSNDDLEISKDFTNIKDEVHAIKPKDEPINEKIKISEYYSFENFNEVLKRLELENLDSEELVKYETSINDFFESAANQHSKEFLLDKSQITVNIKILSSFELTEQELFCRQFEQFIDFKIANITYNGVSCLKDLAWKLMKKKK